MKELLSRSPWLYVVLFVVVAIIMTLYEAAKEYIFKGALTPWQSHTITILITSFLVTFAAIVIRSRSESINHREQIVKLQQQNVTLQQKNIHTFKLTLDTVHNIVNDFIIHYRFIMRDIKKEDSVCKEAMDILDSRIEEVVQQLKILESLDYPDKEEDYKILQQEES